LFVHQKKNTTQLHRNQLIGRIKSGINKRI